MDQHEHLAAGRSKSGSTHLERLVQAIRTVRTVHDQHHRRTIGGPGRGGTDGVTNDPATLEYALATAPPNLRPSIEQMVRRHLPEKPPWPVKVALTLVEEELLSCFDGERFDEPIPNATATTGQGRDEEPDPPSPEPLDPTASELAILHVLPSSEHQHGMPATAVAAHLEERGHALVPASVKRLLRDPFLSAHTKQDARKSRSRNAAGDAFVEEHPFPKTRPSRKR